MGWAPPLRSESTAASMYSCGVVDARRSDTHGALRGSLRQALRHIRVMSLQASVPSGLTPPTVTYVGVTHHFIWGRGGGGEVGGREVGGGGGRR